MRAGTAHLVHAAAFNSCAPPLPLLQELFADLQYRGRPAAHLHAQPPPLTMGHRRVSMAGAPPPALPKPSPRSEESITYHEFVTLFMHGPAPHL